MKILFRIFGEFFFSTLIILAPSYPIYWICQKIAENMNFQCPSYITLTLIIAIVYLVITRILTITALLVDEIKQ